MQIAAQKNLLRVRKEHEHGKVDFVELFFDLVFVFAVTQLSHFLLKHFTPLGALQTTLLLMGVWWVWIFTTWVTNWLEPQALPVRLLLLALMLAGLVLSTSLPQAFGARSLPFALAYVSMQVLRSLFMVWALHRHQSNNLRNFQRITVWMVISGIFWIAGALAPAENRLAIWLVALAVEYAGPLFRFWTPFIGASTTADWDVDGGHIAERCALFIIIALGESVLVTGATFADLVWTSATAAAFLASFLGSVAMWWIYFHKGESGGSQSFEATNDPGRLARSAYTYLHLPIVAGIIVTAVGDEHVLAHPAGHMTTSTLASIVGGPALFLIGILFFKRATMGYYAFSHFVGLSVLAVVAAAPLLHLPLSPLICTLASTAALVTVAVWETVSWRIYARKYGLPSTTE